MELSILFELKRGIWYMQPASAYSLYTDIQNLLTRQNTAGEPKKVQIENSISFKSATTLKNINSSWDLGSVPKDSVAVINITNPITQYDYCGIPGTSTMAKWISQLNDNPNVKAIALNINSPGGAALGTKDFSTALMAVDKPILSYCTGMMCSAAYWIGSTAQQVWSSNDTNIIGSIGTYLTLVDYTQADAKNGIVEHQIYADASTAKNATYREALAGNYQPIKDTIINPMNDAFIASIKKNRYGKKLDNNVFDGRDMTASVALKAGLIDGIGSFEQAIKSILK